MDCRNKNIVDLYKQGLSLKQVGLKVGLTEARIFQILKYLNIPRRSFEEAGFISGCKNRRYILDEACFDNLKDPCVKYWLGFLLADGCVHQRSFNIRLARKDKEHLEKFRCFLKTDRPVKDMTIKASHGMPIRFQSDLYICSIRLVNKLISLGVGPAKSFTANPPEVLKWDKDFWRGVIDGDGSIVLRGDKKFPVLTLIGSKDTVEAFLNFVKKHTITNAHVKPKDSVYDLYLSGQPARDIIDLLYVNSITSLDRKLQRSQDRTWIRRVKLSSEEFAKHRRESAKRYYDKKKLDLI